MKKTVYELKDCLSPNETSVETIDLNSTRDEMDDVWKEYQRSSLHATGNEVFSWMESWFSDYEKPIPECHK